MLNDSEEESEDESQDSRNPLFDLIGSGLNTVGNTIGTVVTSDNKRKIAQAAAEKDKEVASIAAKTAKTTAFIALVGITILAALVGIIFWSKKPKYFQVSQGGMQTYALSGIHAPKIA